MGYNDVIADNKQKPLIRKGWIYTMILIVGLGNQEKNMQIQDTILVFASLNAYPRFTTFL